MPEAIITPNVESALRPYLQERLTTRSITAAVATRLPTAKPLPSQFIRYFLAGGRPTGLVTRQQRFVFDFYGPSETAAYALGAVVLGELLSIDYYAGIQFYTPELASELTNLPDPSFSDRARYSATFAVVIRAHAV